MLGIVAVGIVRSPENFKRTMYRAHCAVIFAIAQLSCSSNWSGVEHPYSFCSQTSHDRARGELVRSVKPAFVVDINI